MGFQVAFLPLNLSWAAWQACLGSCSLGPGIVLNSVRSMTERLLCSHQPDAHSPLVPGPGRGDVCIATVTQT